jgi:hypothetical protein
MIRTSRSRLEIRQEPDRAASLAGSVLLAVGGVQALLAVGAMVAEWALPVGRGFLGQAVRLLVSAGFAASGWFFLRGRSRTVLDLDHRMVARYMGVGGHSVGGNRSWDLAEFVAVVLVRREHRRLLHGVRNRSEVVCLRRPDGSDLELYWSDGDGDEVAASVAGFSGLPYLGGRAR